MLSTIRRNLPGLRKGYAFLAGTLLAVMPGVTHAAGLPALEKLSAGKFEISAEIKMLDNHRVLGQDNARSLLTPASLSKLYVASAALDRYGPQHRFTTRLMSTGQIRGNVLYGNLYVDGGGAPAMTTEEYWSLVQQLHAIGIDHIRGQVLLAQWPYGPSPCLVSDRCKAMTASSNSYDALLSPVAVNYGNWCTEIVPTQPGRPAHVSSCFGPRSLLPVRGTVRTVSAGHTTGIGARRVTENGIDTLMLSGQISTADGPRQLFRSSSNPSSETAEILRNLLAQNNISVSGGVSVYPHTIPESASEVASVDSPPLQMALMDMLDYSNNFMADTLTMDMSSSTPATMESGTSYIEKFVSQNVPGHGPLTLMSGSGLTPENRTSAQGLVSLLNYMYHRSELFPTLYAAMQTPYNGVAGHIRHGSDLFQHNVMVKTGTLDQPVGVRSIAGYFRTASGRWGAFAVMLRGHDGPPYLNWPIVMQALSDDLTPIIRNN